MRILVIGGTAFVGRHIVEAAVEDGHEVTVFNRGFTNAGAFPDLEHLHGDRDAGDLRSLAVGSWDAVVDVCAYVPRHVTTLAAALGARVGAYCLISTVSVYADTATIGGDESTALLEHPDPESEDRTLYGPLKVLCERAVSGAFGDRALVIRPGIVVGTHDGSERFNYWVRRVARGGRILGPPRPDQPVQLVHAADQARFVISRLESGAGGVFDTVGDVVSFAAMVDACATAGGAPQEVVWASQDVLRAHKVDLPLVLSASGRWDGMFSRSGAAARAAGMVNRPLVDTAREVLAWDRTRDPSLYRGLSPDDEAAVLAAM